MRASAAAAGLTALNCWDLSWWGRSVASQKQLGIGATLQAQSRMLWAHFCSACFRGNSHSSGSQTPRFIPLASPHHATGGSAAPLICSSILKKKSCFAHRPDWA